MIECRGERLKSHLIAIGLFKLTMHCFSANEAVQFDCKTLHSSLKYLVNYISVRMRIPATCVSVTAASSAEENQYRSGIKELFFQNKTPELLMGKIVNAYARRLVETLLSYVITF